MLKEKTGDGGRKTEEGGEAGDRKPELVWEEVAAEMVEIFDPAGEDGDEVRERRYRALLPKYRKLGKVAPEFLPVEELRALDEEEIRGLFLENEAHGSRLTADSDRGLVTGDREIRVEVESAIELLKKILSRFEVPTSEGEDEDGVIEDELMIRAMENKIKLQMRSLK